MSQEKLTEHDLKRELTRFSEQYTQLHDDQLFVLWFLRAYVTENDQIAVTALCGGPDDKGIDAVLIDNQAKNVFVVQGKYHSVFGKHSEKYSEVMHFAQLAHILTSEHQGFAEFCKGLSVQVLERLVKARTHIVKDGYHLHLCYATTGKCSLKLTKEATKLAASANCDSVLEIKDWRKVLSLLDYYLRDASPVPSLDLAIEGNGHAEVKSVFHRYDHETDIESWIFSMSGQAVAEMYKSAGPRLFALNIRGYLGNKEINQDIAETLEKTPEYFWYYNNGLTIVCDDAEKISSHGMEVLHVSHPQVINGQQTTRTLDKLVSNKNATKVSVTVRVIRVPHEDGDQFSHYDVLVPQIVKATNWQNSIAASDLVSNDRRQIEIHRQFRKLGYWYIRKKQAKSEAIAEAGAQYYIAIDKTEIAKAVAACDLDPVTVRLGKEGLFAEDMYAKVFPTSNPYYYLCRYWTMVCVSQTAYGYPERAYAKWLVLHFVWERLAPLLHSKANIENFRRAWESYQDTDTMDHLWKANTAVFGAALKFYRLNRGTGATATDVSTYFKHAKLHIEFEKFWKSSNNNYRAPFQKAWKKFEEALAWEFEN